MLYMATLIKGERLKIFLEERNPAIRKPRTNIMGQDVQRRAQTRHEFMENPGGILGCRRDRKYSRIPEAW
jgi:hypothetical protein